MLNANQFFRMYHLNVRWIICVFFYFFHPYYHYKIVLTFRDWLSFLRKTLYKDKTGTCWEINITSYQKNWLKKSALYLIFFFERGKLHFFGMVWIIVIPCGSHLQIHSVPQEKLELEIYFKCVCIYIFHWKVLNTTSE